MPDDHHGQAEQRALAALRAVLARVAPGTPLREGLERILRGRTGALIVLGHNPTVEALCDGGFRFDVEFSPTRLRELSKMDGAVILSDDASRIVRANVQLMPDATIPTVESGTRHRTAERVGLQTGLPVIAVSHSMSIISLYHGGVRHVVADPSIILARANQALATLQRYKARLDEVTAALSAMEIEDVATLRDAMTVLQRLLLVRRIAGELSSSVIELGTDGRLLGLQLDELVTGTEGLRELLLRDYLPDLAVPGTVVPDGSPDPDEAVELAVDGLRALTEPELLDLAAVARVLGYPTGADGLDVAVSPRGYRLLSGIPRVPQAILDRLIAHFGNLQGLLAATAADLQLVDGVGENRARVVREGLSRLAESSIVDRYGSPL
ncbi:DNA integrity scanning protein DisA [Nakamurella sp. YIM 132087]|uniref:DNA integrity scanning protein DisA n=1 Tax=Nakamurella alba TaxID=2665158 RepID=A0A7K1FP02_9ACTN|nr:DNA integrity scanning diadenylate cyclase DisA [Nakamurella alba]MTD14524.1 DNA integrity scanning protein DisA [Nakamurella alba]